MMQFIGQLFNIRITGNHASHVTTVTTYNRRSSNLSFRCTLTALMFHYCISFLFYNQTTDSTDSKARLGSKLARLSVFFFKLSRYYLYVSAHAVCRWPEK